MEKKLKWLLVKIVILNYFCSIMLIKMFVVFEIYEVKVFSVLAPKSPYHVTYDLDFDMIRLRMSRATLLLLTLISIY